MAYFDTSKTTAAIPATRASFVQVAKTVMTTIAQALPKSTKSPEDIVAAQHRAEAARRKVDNLLR